MCSSAWIYAWPINRNPLLVPPTPTRRARRAQPAPLAPAASAAPEHYRLRLFVAGASVRSRQAILRVQQLCAGELAGRCDLEVIDIFQQPGLAQANQIVATPTLIITAPLPARRFIGSLALLTAFSVQVEGDRPAGAHL